MVSSSNKSIGILGGSFDPAHKGHLTISKIALKKIKLDKIFWIINKKNPFKNKAYYSLEKRLYLAKKITNSVKIPVIGIGSGENCNGQVQVLYDLIGISNNPPKFAQNFLKKSGSIEKALKDFYRYVKSIKIK